MKKLLISTLILLSIIIVPLLNNRLNAMEKTATMSMVEEHLDRLFPTIGGIGMRKWVGPTITYLEFGLSKEDSQFLNWVMSRVSATTGLDFKRKDTSKGTDGVSLYFAFSDHPKIMLKSSIGRQIFKYPNQSEEEYLEKVEKNADKANYKSNAFLNVGHLIGNDVFLAAMVVADHSRLEKNKLRGLILTSVLSVFVNAASSDSPFPSMFNNDRDFWGHGKPLEDFYPVDLAILELLYKEQVAVGMSRDAAKKYMATQIETRYQKHFAE